MRKIDSLRLRLAGPGSFCSRDWRGRGSGDRSSNGLGRRRSGYRGRESRGGGRVRSPCFGFPVSVSFA